MKYIYIYMIFRTSKKKFEGTEAHRAACSIA